MSTTTNSSNNNNNNNKLRHRQKKSNKRLRRTVQPLAALSAHEHDAVGRALLSVMEMGGEQEAPQEPAAHQHAQVQAALERVAVWRLRLTRLPHAVESTAALAQVLWQMETAAAAAAAAANSASATPTATSTASVLRYALSCAVLRTVNGLADTLQQQRATAGSVAVLCRELGLPSWLVDLRHESTHNQLPALPTLRLAAVALLRYLATVYWEPLEANRRALHQEAVELLQAYDRVDDEAPTASEGKSGESSNKKKDNVKNNNNNHKEQKVVADVVESSSDSEDDDDDGEEKDNRALECSLLPIPGTNANRFSILLDNDKKSKSKKRAAAAAPDVSPVATKTAEESPKRKRSRKSNKADSELEPATRSSCAKLFTTRSNIPLDIKYQAALDYLIGENGVLLSVKNVKDEKKSAIEKYETLLITLGRVWPGFLTALLIRSVDLVLRRDESGARSERNVGLIRYWLSRGFLDPILMDTDGNKNSKKAASIRSSANNSSEELAPLSTLEALQFPLNSLCDRCEVVADHSRGAAALVQVFSEILGEERCRHCGIADAVAALTSRHNPTDDVATKPNNRSGSDKGTIDEQMQASLLRKEPPATTTTKDSINNYTASIPIAPPTSSMSLAAMEAFLAVDSDSVSAPNEKDPSRNDSSAADDTTPELSTTTWIRCASWEPCAIGTLPGFGDSLS